MKDTIYLNDIEVKIMSVFVAEKILDDSQIANILTQLANKLVREGEEK